MRLRRAIVAALLLSLCLGACDRVRSVDTIVSRGETQYQQGHYRAALGDFKTALERDGDNLVARAYLARISYHLADFEGAQDAVDRVLAAGKRDSEMVALKYETLLARRQPEEVLKNLATESGLNEVQRLLYTAQAKAELSQVTDAVAVFERALSLAPNDVAILVAQSRLYAAMGDLERAAASIEPVLKQDQNNASALFVQGGLLVAKGDLDGARTSLVKAEKLGQRQLNWSEQARLYALLTDLGLRSRNADDAARWINGVESRAPQSPVAYYLRGRLALLKDNTNDALAQLQQAVKAGDYLPAQLLLVNVLMTQSNYGQAEDLLNKLRNAHPDNVEVRKLLAQLYLTTKRPEEARKVLPQAKETDAVADAQLDWLRGQSLMAAGANDEGIALLEKSLAAGHGNPERALQLARAYIGAGQRDKAVALLNSLPVDAGGRQRQGLLVLASVMGKSAADARREIDALLVRYPQDSNLFAAAGAILVQSGDTPAAIVLLNKAVALAPDNLDARLAMASLLMQSKQYEQAETQLRAVLARDAKQVKALQGMASVALAKGDKAQAVKQLEQAIGADPAAVEPRLQLAQLAIADKNVERATSLLEQAVTASSNSPTVLNAAGQLLLQVKQYEAALAYFEQANAAGMKSARISAAQVNLALGQTAEAVQKLEAAAGDSETQVQAVALLAQQDVSAGKLEIALQRIARLRQSKVKAEVVEEMTGDAYALAKQFAQAVTSYERAVKLAPAQRLAIKEYQARAAGRLSTPAAPLDAWLARKPDDVVARRVLAQFLATSGNNAGAIREYERLMSASPSRDPVILNELAWLYQLQKDARAEAMAHEAYQAAPGIAAIADTYGWILLNAGKTTDALPILEKAAAAAKTNYEIQYHLAAAQARSGQKDTARSTLQQALAGSRPFSSRSEAENLLASLAK